MLKESISHSNERVAEVDMLTLVDRSTSSSVGRRRGYSLVALGSDDGAASDASLLVGR